MVELPILHFNDVYRVAPQKLPHSSETVDVTQFAYLLEQLRDTWPLNGDGKRDGLLLFSGDVFSPSVESSVTRGSHMVPVMNFLKLDVSLTGNHDFDFGFPHLTNLIADTNFPWLLSNIRDSSTGTVPERTQEYIVLERAGVRIGVIGLVEREWIGTISSWPPNFEWLDMVETGIRLSKKLRDPEGDHKCDIIIALTHARIPNDITLAKALHASSPGITSHLDTHGVDIILGGHDHLYYVSKGVSSWEDYDTTQPVLGAESDEGDILVIKSGTDFRDLSDFILEIEDSPEGSVRRKYIKRIQGKRHEITPELPKSKPLQEILSELLSSVSDSMKAAVCKTEVSLDLRSQLIRTAETASSNWFADVLHPAYDDALIKNGSGAADGVFICAGTLRGDSVYGPGKITLGDILEILPFEDSVVVLELDGESIWNALESSLETWPAQEGRFPIVSGFRVEWDSRKPPGQRVLSVRMQIHRDEDESISSVASSESATPKISEYEPVLREKNGRTYRIVTREYMAQGHDGFTALQGHKYLIDDENGQLMSSLVRKYLLGAKYIKRLCRPDVIPVKFESSVSAHIVSRAQARSKRQKLLNAVAKALSKKKTRVHHRSYYSIATKEHMSGVDCFDGKAARSSFKQAGGSDDNDADLIVIHPTVDGRMKDVARP